MGNAESLIITGVVFIIMVLVGWQVKKKMEKDKIGLGEFINKHLLREQISWIIIVLISICISEGVLAASIPLENEYMNPWSRMIAHISLSLLAIIIAVGAPRVLITWLYYTGDLFQALSGKKYNSNKTRDRRRSPNQAPNTNKSKILTVFVIRWAVMSAILGLTALLSIQLPYYNVSIIANGLGEMSLTKLAYLDMWFGSNTMNKLYLKYGYIQQAGQSFNPTEAMTMTMFASWILYKGHLALALLDGLWAANDYVNNDIKRDALRPNNIHNNINSRGNNRSNNRGNNRSSNRDNNPPEDPTDLIEKLLEFTNVMNTQDAFDRKVGDLVEKFYDSNEFDNAARNNLTGHMTRLANEIDDLENDTEMSQQQYNRNEKNLIRDIKDFFKRQTKQGKGFGSPLPRA